MKNLKKKLKKLFQSPKAKKVAAVAMAICCLALNAVTCFAAEGDTATDISAAKEGVETIFGELSSIFSFTNIVSFIAIAIGSAALLTLAWFGLRKVISMIQKALKGKGVRA